jgi:hypothetical protein
VDVVSSGRAYGKNRDYQAFCRDVLRKSEPALTPISGDGLDVPIAVGGTTWSFDVALEVAGDHILVAECRRRREPVKQGDLAEFAFKVDLLRKARPVPVAGVFFGKSRYQKGAVAAAQEAAISTAIVGDNNSIESGFGIEYHRIDPVTRKRARDVTFHVAAGVYAVSGTAANLRVTGTKDPP